MREITADKNKRDYQRTVSYCIRTVTISNSVAGYFSKKSLSLRQSKKYIGLGVKDLAAIFRAIIKGVAMIIKSNDFFYTKYSTIYCKEIEKDF
jgi:hypothetical protein